MKLQQIQNREPLKSTPVEQAFSRVLELKIMHDGDKARAAPSCAELIVEIFSPPPPWKPPDPQQGISKLASEMRRMNKNKKRMSNATMKISVANIDVEMNPEKETDPTKSNWDHHTERDVS